VCSRVYSQLTV